MSKTKPKVSPVRNRDAMNTFLFAIILASSISLGAGLQCHQCSTLETKKCVDHYTADNLGECDNDNYCVKLKTIVWIRDSGYINGWERESSVVTRTCEEQNGRKEGCVGQQNNGGILIKCYCGSDGCNVGRTLTPKFITAFFGCLVAFMVLNLSLRH